MRQDTQPGTRRGDRNGSNRERAGIPGFGHHAGWVIRVCDARLVVQYPGISARIPSAAEGAAPPAIRAAGSTARRERIEYMGALELLADAMMDDELSPALDSQLGHVSRKTRLATRGYNKSNRSVNREEHSMDWIGNIFYMVQTSFGLCLSK